MVVVVFFFLAGLVFIVVSAFSSCNVWASLCSDFCCSAQALGSQASVVAA